MATTLTSVFLAELKKNVNQPNVIVEVALDTGTKKFGFSTGGFSDVLPVLKSVSSLQNRIDTKEGYSTRGQITAVITGRDNFRALVKDEYLKNRRITRKDGFVASGFAYSDYADTFTGKILDWSRKGGELTLVLGDDMMTDASKKIPEANATKTQKIDYRNTNPVDIMKSILLTHLGIPAVYVDSVQFDSERDLWLNGWKFDRVLTEPKAANEYLNELQQETNSFVIHDGEKISFKIFAPPVPGQTIEEWREDYELLKDSFTQKSGYRENFFNQVWIYYNYDESGSDKEENFENLFIAADAASQGASEWDETKTKVIKSKWIRTLTYLQPTNITGVTIYHCSKANGTGSGTLTYNQAANTLTWKAPGGTAGDTVTLDNDGKYQLFDANKTKRIRVIVDTSSLPGSNQTDTITISSLNGDSYATTIANKILNRYRDPVATVGFSIDINNMAYK
jgi:hypothetical protein